MGASWARPCTLEKRIGADSLFRLGGDRRNSRARPALLPAASNQDRALKHQVLGYLPGLWKMLIGYLPEKHAWQNPSLGSDGISSIFPSER